MNDESYKIKEKEKEENIFLAHFIEFLQAYGSHAIQNLVSQMFYIAYRACVKDDFGRFGLESNKYKFQILANLCRRQRVIVDFYTSHTQAHRNYL